ncbi:MAG: ABC transporter ATP-binding protein [Olsenella sp.]|nr:ABC transporter ATP-binding protein [Olsenella sp.]
MSDRVIWEIVGARRRDSLAYVGLCLATFLTDVIAAVCIAWVISEATGGSGVPALAIVAMTLALVGRSALSFLQARRRIGAQCTASLALNTRLSEKFARICWTRVAQEHSADFLWCAGEGARRLGEYYGEILPRATATFVLAIPVAPVALVLSWRVGVAYLVSVAALCLSLPMAASYERRRVVSDRAVDAGEVSRSAHDYFATVMRESELLRDYHVESDFVELAAERGARAEVARLAHGERGLLLLSLFLSVGACGSVAIGYLCSGLARSGSVSAFASIVLALVCVYALSRIAMLGMSLTHLVEAEVAEKSIKELLSLREPVETGTEGVEPGDHLALGHVSYYYDTDRPALADVSLDIPAVGLTAIVGPAGSGKTTLAQILSGHVVDYRGNVLLGGKQLRDVPRAARLRYVTHVDGSCGLMAASVRENLQMGDISASDAEMWSVLETVGLDSEVRRFGGLDFDLSDAEADLSLSERLRLALARALLHNSPVFVIDALMDDVNPVDGQRAMMALRAIARYKAVVYLTRHPSQAQYARREYVLSEGRLVAAGTHEELMRDCEKYRLAWEEQDRALNFTALPSDETVNLGRREVEAHERR